MQEHCLQRKSLGILDSAVRLTIRMKTSIPSGQRKILITTLMIFTCTLMVHSYNSFYSSALHQHNRSVTSLHEEKVATWLTTKSVDKSYISDNRSVENIVLGNVINNNVLAGSNTRLLSILKSNPMILQNTKSKPSIPLYRQRKRAPYVVPNTAHYIWQTKKPTELQFHQLLSLLSTYKIMKPNRIYLHYDIEPIGQYWLEAKSKIPNLVLTKWDTPTEVFGEQLKPPKFDTSNSNVLRLQIMQQYGGVYLDLDVIILNSLDPLRQYQTTLGYESAGLVCGGFIMSAPHAPFIYLWMNNMMNDYQVDKWAYISGWLPSRLIDRYQGTQIIHVEPERLHRPNWRHLSQIIGPELYDWSNNYAIHLWHRLWVKNESWSEWKFEESPQSIKKMNTTFGQIARKIYYGSKDML